MSTPRNPFAKSTAIAGKGEIEVSLLPPSKQVLRTFNYQYPLKLISPDPHSVIVTDTGEDAAKQRPITTVFLLTYGGGLLAGDSIDLTITCNPYTRLALLTQGSTKIFKTSIGGDANSKPNTGTILASQIAQKPTSQTLNILLHPHATLCYLPDPNQPHANSNYQQRQTIYVDPHGSSSLLFLDWVSEGRTHRGESWTLTSWQGRNEVREYDPHSSGRLLIRDALHLTGGGDNKQQTLSLKTDGKGILGTLIIYGPRWKSLADHFIKEFKALPRLGGKSWTPGAKSIAEEGGTDYFDAGSKVMRREQEAEDQLVWTAAQVRGFVLVKFGSKEVEGSRRWLGGMLRREGSVEREMGHQALFCLGT